MMMVWRHPFLVSLAILVTAGVVAFPIAWGSDVVVARVNLDQLPRRILGLEGRDDRFEESVYRVLNADYHVLRDYRGGGNRQVWLYIGYYGTAKGGRSSHVPQACYTGQGFSIVEWTKVPAPSPEPSRRVDGMLNKMHVKRGKVHQAVLFWYQSKDKVLATGIEQNLNRLKNRLLYNRDDGAFVRVSTSMDLDNEAEAWALVRDFSRQLLRVLPDYWPEERVRQTPESRVSRVKS
jgi:EpsI family protein